MKRIEPYKIGIYIVVIVLSIIWLFPLVSMLTIVVKSPDDFNTMRFWSLPKLKKIPANIAYNFGYAWRRSRLGENFLNSPYTERRVFQICDPRISTMVCDPSFVVEPGDNVDIPFRAGPFEDWRQLNASSEPYLSLQLSATQTLFDGGRSWSVLERARLDKKRREASLRATKASLRYSVTRAFYATARAERAVEP